MGNEKREIRRVIDPSDREISPGRKILKSFVEIDLKNFTEWLWVDYIVPGAKNFVLDAISKVFWGDSTRTSSGYSRRRSDYKEDYTRHSKYSYSSSSGTTDRRTVEKPRKTEDIPDYRDIPSMSAGKANDIISQINDWLEDYPNRTVTQFYYMCGYDSLDPIDNKWGWTKETMRGLGTRRAPRGEVYLVVPEAQPL